MSKLKQFQARVLQNDIKSKASLSENRFENGMRNSSLNVIVEENETNQKLKNEIEVLNRKLEIAKQALERVLEIDEYYSWQVADLALKKLEQK